VGDVRWVVGLGGEGMGVEEEKTGARGFLNV
jgi:hypothetical protein